MYPREVTTIIILCQGVTKSIFRGYYYKENYKRKSGTIGEKQCFNYSRIIITVIAKRTSGKHNFKSSNSNVGMYAIVNPKSGNIYKARIHSWFKRTIPE